jgi:hypothetical protein
MKARFLACSGCHRHVKQGDASCPFCGAAAPSAEPLPRPPGVRMTRAAMFAAGAAGTVAAIVDCGQTAGPTASAFYGVACTGSECVPGSQDAAPSPYDGGSVVVFYGIACTGDACVPPLPIKEDAGGVDASDASPSDAGDAKADEDASDG